MNGGFVAIVGRPNVGKSTLVNALAGAKVSIVSRRRQTTRGVVRTEFLHGGARIALLDSPGWQTNRGGDFSRAINGGARWAAESADAIVFMTTPRWTNEDADFLSRLPPQVPTVAAINKIDLVRDKRTLLPFADELRRRRDFAAVVPLSAERGTGVSALADEIAALLPPAESPPPTADSAVDFAADSAEDRDFLLGEILREKLFRALGGELPYRVGVAATSRQKPGVLHVRADIYAERDSQKAIVLGGGGAMLKKLATAARRDMERFCGGKVFLDARVLVRPEWRRDLRLLAKMRIGAPLQFRPPRDIQLKK